MSATASTADWTTLSIAASCRRGHCAPTCRGSRPAGRGHTLAGHQAMGPSFTRATVPPPDGAKHVACRCVTRPCPAHIESSRRKHCPARDAGRRPSRGPGLRPVDLRRRRRAPPGPLRGHGRRAPLRHRGRRAPAAGAARAVAAAPRPGGRADRLGPRAAQPTTSSSPATARTASRTAAAPSRPTSCGSGAGPPWRAGTRGRIGMATPQVMIGSQTLHATGYALGLRQGRRRLGRRRVLRRRRHQQGRRARGDGVRRDVPGAR